MNVIKDLAATGCGSCVHIHIWAIYDDQSVCYAQCTILHKFKIGVDIIFSSLLG